MSQSEFLKYLLFAGFIAGALDIIFACSFWALRAHVPPVQILQSISAGMLGKASFAGGLPTAALGLALHFAMASFMAAVYLWLAQRWPMLAAQPMRWGALYGILLYGVMNGLVVPLSRAMPVAKDSLWIGMSVLAHILLVGLPIAWVAHRALTPAVILD